MKNTKRFALTTAALTCLATSVACSGADTGSSDEVTSEQTEALTVARPAARLILNDAVLTRLRARASSGDASWLELKKRCDDYATGTVHAPNGTSYPSYPNVGQGYQGDEYLPVVRALGICYRTVQGVDSVAESRYGAAGSRVLEAMSTPTTSGGFVPSTNSGYGIRHYAVGMALGYDWLYPALSSTLKSRLITSLNTWIDWYDTSGFLRSDPIANYFTGYFLAKVTTALATEGDNPKAAAYWSDVETRLWGQLVKPRFASMMTGGGWPEGWGYGKKAVLSIAESMWAAKTAKGLDWWSELPQLEQQAEYVTHFAWPSLKHMDDQGTIRSGSNLRASAELVSGLATMMEAAGRPGSAQVRGFVADVVATAGDDRPVWSKFLYGDPGAASASHTSKPLSYVAQGPNHAAMRSSWDKGAVWGALSGGAYINAKDSSEQLYNAGGLSVVRGDQPVLINATGWLPQNAGTAGENFVYSDSYQIRQRRLYNTFFVDDASNPYNPGQNNFAPGESDAHLDRFEEGGRFVRTRAVGLEDQYGWRNGSRPVASFSRDLVYVRPGAFVLLDRTTVTNGSADQWLSFHTPVAPAAQSVSDATQRRFNVNVAGQTVGSVSTLLPRSADVRTVSLPGGASRIEAHAPTRTAQQQWLSVVTADGAAPEQIRLSTADGNVSEGGLVGVMLRSARPQVVLFSGDAPATSATYRVSPNADSDHVLVDLAPSSTGYAVTVTRGSSDLTVRVSPGGSLRASSGGTLSFSVSATGAVTANAPATAQPIATTPAPAPTPTPAPAPTTTTPAPAPAPAPTPTTTPAPTPTTNAAGQQVVSFTQGVNGYTGARDASITNQYFSSSNPRGTTYKTNDALYAYTLSYAAKALMRFDVSSVPSDARVIAAKLDVTVESWATSQALAGQFLRTPWSYDAAALGWTRATDSSSWATAGIGAADVTGPGFRFDGITASGYQRRSVALDPAAVQSWVTHAQANQGVVLSNGASGKVLRVLASEASDPAKRPTLTVTYQR